MKLVLTLPDAWVVRTHGEQQVAVVSPDLVLAWGWLVPFPDQPAVWVQRAMHADVTAPATVTAGAAETRATRDGWTLKLLEAEVRLAGALAEYRLGAFYQFLEYGAVALVRARHRDALAAIRPQLIDVLETGRPDWQAGRLPVCLHDLFAP